MVIDEATREQARAVLKNLARVPDRYRNFEVGERTASKSFGLTAGMLNAFIEDGLEHRDRPDGRVFDQRDLATLSTHLQLPSPRRSAMLLWLRTISRLSDGPISCTVEVSARIRSARPEQEFTALRPDATYLPADVVADSVVSMASTSLTPVAVELPIPISEFLLALSDIDHYFLPEQMSNDPALFHEARIADCRSFSVLGTELATEAGIEARASWGLIVAAPYSTSHAWMEFRIGGHWVPVDIHLARAMRQWSLTTIPLLELAVGLGGIYWRWSETPMPFLQPARDLAFPTFTTRYRAKGT